MVTLKENKVVIQKRRKYLRELGMEPIKEYVQIRSSMVNLLRKLKRSIRELLNVDVEDISNEASTSSCTICPRKTRIQSKT